MGEGWYVVLDPKIDIGWGASGKSGDRSLVLSLALSINNGSITLREDVDMDTYVTVYPGS